MPRPANTRDRALPSPDAGHGAAVRLLCGPPSSRQLARKLEADMAFRGLAAHNAPDFRPIAEFRTQHLAELKGVWLHGLRLCRQAGVGKLGHVAWDGT